MTNIFGKLHSVPQDIHGDKVLSIETDQQNSENVIITCTDSIKIYETEGRAIKSSWLCKSWATPSSGCTNNSSGEFYCPVSSTKILQWTQQEQELDNIKPIKLNSSIHMLYPHNGSVFVVFAGGFVEEITKAIVNKKETKPLLLFRGGLIQNVIIINNMVMLTTVTKDIEGSDSVHRVHHYPMSCSCAEDVTSLDVLRPGLRLTGMTLTTRSTLVTLWSNGELCRSVIAPSANDLKLPLMFNVMGNNLNNSIVCTKPAKILQVTGTHVALLGQDASKDGGRVCLWDLDLSLDIGRRNFKIYKPEMRCWATNNNNYSSLEESSMADQVSGTEGAGNALFLQEKRQVTVMPLAQLPNHGLQQVLDAEIKLLIENDDPIIRHDWCTKKIVTSPSKHSIGGQKLLVNGFSSPHHLVKMEVDDASTPSSKTKKNKKSRRSSTGVKESLLQSAKDRIEHVIHTHNLATLDDSLCCEVIVNKALETKDMSMVFEILLQFKDIPERSLVDILSKVLAGKEKHFKDLMPIVASRITSPTTTTTHNDDLDADRQLSIMFNEDNILVMPNNETPPTPKNSSDRTKTKKRRSLLASQQQNGCAQRNGDDDSTFTNANSSIHENSDSLQTDLHQKTEGEARKLSGPRRLLINMLLSLPVMKDQLCVELRRLPFRDSLTLIDYLKSLLAFDLHWCDSRMPHINASYERLVSLLPTEERVSLWVVMLCDAHYQALLLEQQLNNRTLASRSAISNCNKPYTNTQKACEVLNLLDAMVVANTPNQNKDLPARCGDLLYTIEKVALSI